MTKLVIDTNVYSFLCRGRSDIARLLAQYDQVLVPTIVLGELEAGFRNGSRYLVNKVGLGQFLSLPQVHILNVDGAAAEAYGRIYSALKATGNMIPINDVWIASQAIAENATFVTFDAHFSKIHGLDLILKTVD